MSRRSSKRDKLNAARDKVKRKKWSLFTGEKGLC